MLTDTLSRFLLVFLSIETILQEPTIYRRRQKLRAMKNGLDLGGAYAAMLGRIKAEGGEKARLGMAVLMWISHSQRPLQADELCYAIAIRIESNDLDNDDIPTISTLVDCCQGLVTVDKGGSTVRLIHFTLHEHLRAHPDLFDRAHSTMAETCLTYLNFQRVKDLPAGLSSDPRNTPFLEYSSLYWGSHMRIELSDRAVTFALQLLDQFSSHISAEYLWKSIKNGFPFGYYFGDKPFSALHCISYFGIPEVAYALIKMGRWNLNQRDCLGVTPLIWAARYGHEGVVRLLVREKHIQPDQHDANNGRTALSWAAGNGHEGVVGTFLGEQFVNPGSVGRRWGKSARVVNLLFGDRYVNPNSSSKFGRTPLWWAVENGHEGIVKLLLAREDVNPDTPDTKYGQTQLLLAARQSYEGIVKLLLGRKDVNPNTPDAIFGQTPLLWAVENGHEGIVKLLLGREDVNPNAPDTKYGRTPLSRAARNGHKGVIKLLFERKDVNPDTPGTKYGQTLLSLAAQEDYEEIVELLLRQEDVNLGTPDTRYDKTPLLLAAQQNFGGRTMWPGRDDGASAMWSGRYVGLGTQDTGPDNPSLSWAARNGREEIVKLLLEQKDVTPDTRDEYGRTPLLWAAMNGHEGTVKLLLGSKDVNPNSSSNSGETALGLATYYRHHRVVELLQVQHP